MGMHMKQFADWRDNRFQPLERRAEQIASLDASMRLKSASALVGQVKQLLLDLNEPGAMPKPRDQNAVDWAGAVQVLTDESGRLHASRLLDEIDHYGKTTAAALRDAMLLLGRVYSFDLVCGRCGERQTGEPTTTALGVRCEKCRKLDHVDAAAKAPTIFFSWQRDSDNATNRSFIERALDAAIREVSAGLTLEEAPRRDDATNGAVGAVDIAANIARKIDEAAIFVGDVTIIGDVLLRDGERRRPTANPNVLVETGYALKACGEKRVILLFNTALGSIEDLPFDLRPRLVLAYNAPPSQPGLPDPDRSGARRKLAADLAAVIRTMLPLALGAPTR